MLTYQPLKSTMLFAAFVFSLFALTSCGSGKDDSASLAPAQVSPEKDTKANDTKFLSHATDIYFHEILLAKLAQQKGTSPDIIEIGRIVEESSRASKAEITSMSLMKSIPVPTAPSDAANIAYDTLAKVPMEEFDFVYIEQLVQRKADAVSHFESAAREEHDAEIQSWASAKLPGLREQLSKAREINARLHPVSLAD